MKITELAIRRPIASSMIFLLVLLVGIIGFQNLNLDLFPEITFPTAAVVVNYEGAAPPEIEQMVTRPLEEGLAAVSNVQEIYSVSASEQARIMVSFSWGTDMDFATLEMREIVDRIKGRLPDEADEPLVLKFDPGMMPVIEGSITGMDLEVLRREAEDTIESRLERLPGVASVTITGGYEREIQVLLNPEKVRSHGFDIDTIGRTIMAENLNLPAGILEIGNQEYSLRSIGEIEEWEDLNQIILTNEKGSQIRLSELGRVADAHKRITQLTRMNGRDSVGFSVQKEAEANTVLVSRQVRSELEQIEKEYDGALQFEIGLDQATFIENSIQNVMLNAVAGGILAVIILLLFLGNLRTTLIIAVAIPFSVVTTFALLYFGDLTLNMMTLGGLALGIGMLVDNSIVVLENIFRFREEGEDSISAAEKGASQVTAAIIGSTLTTAIVFLPVVFIEGLASQIFTELSLTVAFSLFASLLIALTLLPMLSRYFLAGDFMQNGLIARFQRLVFLPVYSRIENAFNTTLKICLKKKFFVLLLTAAFLSLGGLQFSMIGQGFLPDMDDGEFNISLQMPPGTSLEETGRVVKGIEEELITWNEVRTVFTTIGRTGGRMGGGSGGSESSRLQIRLIPASERQKTTGEVIEQVRSKLARIPGAEYSVTRGEMMGGGMFGAPIAVEIQGRDLSVLESKAREIQSFIRDIEGTREIEISTEEGQPELQVVFDRNRLNRYGLNVSQVGRMVQQAMDGTVVTRWRYEGREYDVRVKYETPSPYQVLQDMQIRSPAGIYVPLKEVADLVYADGPSQIERQNQERLITVTADLVGRDLGTVLNMVESNLETLDLPAGYTVRVGGEMEEMVEAFGSLYYAFALAIVLVFVILSAQFESLVNPLIIMFSVPLALMGSITGLILTGHELNIVAFIGAIMVVGIVVNNVIVLVDYINRLRDMGRDLKEAIIEGAATRLRPILMTASTTILALVPLALGLGEGAELQAPMAVVVISGLIFATFFTLNVIPVFYYLVNLAAARCQELIETNRTKNKSL